MKNKIFPRENYDYWTSLKTRWGDMDGLRHINHAAYLVYMESSRIEYYYSLGYETARWELEESSILASMKIDYLKQVTHPTVLEIGQRITRIGQKSFDILTAIFKQGENDPVLQGLFTLVAYNYKLKKSIHVPGIIRDNSHPLDNK
jgi:acyl-CoA thioester hydrolase